MEELTKKQIKIARTKGGSPCLWESYVEFEDLKRATIIVDSNGKVKNSIFIRRSSDKQSLIPIQKGDFLVKVFEDKEGISKSILEITEISNMSNHAEIMLVLRESPADNFLADEKFSSGEFGDAVLIAERKMIESNFIASELFEKTEKVEYDKE